MTVDGGVRWLGRAATLPDHLWGDDSLAPFAGLPEFLYEALYAPGSAIEVAPVTDPGLSARELVDGLERLVEGSTVESGWVAREAHGLVELERDGLVVFARQIHQTGDTESPVATPRARPMLSPGYWTLLGRRDLPHDARVVRVYWNLAVETSLGFVAAAQSHLDRLAVPFRLKVLRDPVRYRTRADAGVLYLDERDLARAWPAVCEVWRDVGAALDDGVPGWTFRLAPGMGFAFDSGGSLSFGQERCVLLARGLVAAWRQDRSLADDRLEAVHKVFTGAGFRPGSEYLRANQGPQLLDALRMSARGLSSPGRREPVWRQIAKRLCAEAVWHDERCTWIGPSADGDHVWENLGPDLYRGTAGVALTLGEIAARCDIPDVTSAARGAARHAVAGATGRTADAGLFVGNLGVALAAARVGRLLGDAELVAAAASLAAPPLPEPAEIHGGHDLISGLSGSVLALLSLRAMGLCSLDRAVAAGEQLLGRATGTQEILSWDVPGQASMTGLSHGAAGCVLALSELAIATSRDDFMHAAAAAIEGEDRSFDPTFANWIDRRERPDCNERDPPSFATTWCHGAPGIAVSRRRIVDADDHRIDLAFATTAATSLRWLRSGTWNFCLCHGLLGNADILAAGDLWLPGCRDVSDEIVRVATERIDRLDREWPLGPGMEPERGLLTGLAGVAHFFLRRDDPSVPSILALDPASWQVN